MKNDSVNQKLNDWKQKLEEQKANRVKLEPMTAKETTIGVIGIIRLIVAIAMIAIAISYLFYGSDISICLSTHGVRVSAIDLKNYNNQGANFSNNTFYLRIIKNK